MASPLHICCSKYSKYEIYGASIPKQRFSPGNMTQHAAVQPVAVLEEGCSAWLLLGD